MIIFHKTAAIISRSFCRKCELLNPGYYGALIENNYRVASRQLRFSSAVQESDRLQSFKEKLKNGPSFKSLAAVQGTETGHTNKEEFPPYLSKESCTVSRRKVFIEVFGCQMNVNDSEIVWSILDSSGYLKATNAEEADVILIVTCSIREGAEQKIWHRLAHLKGLRRRKSKQKLSLTVGLLGCMAERLKESLLSKNGLVDVVAGPDSYKDLPRLLSLASHGQEAINVMLSLDETYSDVLPIRRDHNSPSAFVSIMRGCDNMCSYCIVPFTRGRERSRPIASILNEISVLADQGVKEVTLLGQNVNSYCDLSEQTYNLTPNQDLSRGFVPKFKRKAKNSGGKVFSDLLDKTSYLFPDIRIRFTSPHPKDFPDQVLYLISERHNLCKSIHLPAQSGNNQVLDRMMRGYTREQYLDLVQHIRSIIPDVALTSDFICGFCDESEEAHKDTVSLLEQVQYHFVYAFPYSMREKTRAYHRLVDNISHEDKSSRVDEVLSTSRAIAYEIHKYKLEEEQLVLIQGVSKRSSKELFGRNDQNTKVIIQQMDVPTTRNSQHVRSIQIGDYVATKITDCTSQVLQGQPLYLTTLKSWQ